MKRLWRRIRGALGIGSLWAGVGSVVGAAVGGVAGLFVGEFGYLLTIGGIGTGAMAFVLGTGFASILSALYRDRTLAELTPKRAGVMGFVAGALVPSLGILVSTLLVGSAVPIDKLVPVVLAAAASYGLVAAGLAAGTVALAKRTPDMLEEGPGAGALLGEGASASDGLLANVTR